MTRISSSSTLFFAVFVPVFWLVFFGSLTIGLLILKPEDLEFQYLGIIRWLFLFFFIVFGLVIYFTLLRLKRIDADDQYIYVTNYIKTIRIPFSQIEELSSKSLSLRLLGKLQLKHRGRFGTNIFFICEADRFDLLQEKLHSISI